jgi:hypothetical protein
VRRLGIRREVHVDRTEDDPFAIGRGHRLLDALQRHHVFEGEGMLGLGKNRKCKKKDKGKKNDTAHGGLRETG